MQPKFNRMQPWVLTTLLSTISSLAISFYWSTDMSAQASSPGVVPKNSWRELENRRNLQPVNGAYYFEFALANGSSAHLVVAYLKGDKWRVRPFISEKTATTSSVAREQSASAAINGGYFNLSNGQSTSYVTLNGLLSADPHKNAALMDNPKLQPFMKQILNRSEIRILEKDSKQEIQIARHDDPLPGKHKLIDSIQAGPRLLPTLDDEEEAFIRKQADGTTADSIGCKKPAARTAFGITRDGYAIFLCVADKAHDKESTGVTLAELADLMKHLGCREAINLDGGSSTSMYVKTENSPDGASVCAKSPETLVKSYLLLSPQ
jgi:hypothetical protein